MPKQTTKTDKFIFPDGLAMDVQPGGVGAFYDFGVFEGGVGITHNFDKVELESGNAGKLLARVKNETMALAPTTLWSWDLESIQKASGGLYTYETIAGTPVVGYSQTTANGDWTYDKFIPFEKQNGSLAAITPTTVTGGTDGLLVENTDYIVMLNAKGESGMIMLAGGNITVTTQDLVTILDYTPSASTKISSGSSSTNLSRSTVRLRHYTDDALTTYDIEIFVYGVDLDAGIAFNFDGANSDTVNGITIAFTGNADTTRTDGKQLFDILIAAGAYVST